MKLSDDLLTAYRESRLSERDRREVERRLADDDDALRRLVALAPPLSRWGRILTWLSSRCRWTTCR